MLFLLEINKKKMEIWIINGPNLNLLGVREPGIYGKETFESHFNKMKASFPGVELKYYQSNSEGNLIDKIHEVGFSCDGIVLNAGAYTHTSVAIADAISAVTSPVVEVHISNISSRESFRHNSFLTPVCVGIIAGFGLRSYNLAVSYLSSLKE